MANAKRNRNRYNRLRPLLLAMIAALLLIASACGGQQSGNAGGTGTGGTGAQTDGGADGGKEPVTLSLWFPGHEDYIVNNVEQVIADFEARYDHVTVEYTPIPWKDYFQKLSVAYSANAAPDVHGLGFGQLISTVEQDQYMDLNSFIQTENWPVAADIYPDIMQAGQWNGGQYGLLIPDVRVLAWRKDLFAQAGLDPEKPPTTTDELFAFAEQLKVVKDGQTIQEGLDMPTSNGEQVFLSLLLPQGQNIYDASNAPLFDSPQAVELLTKMVGLVQSGAVSPQANLQLQGGTFVNGIAAMAFGPPNSFGKLIDSVGAENVGFALPPQGASGQRTALMLGTFLTMSKSTKHQEEAWGLLKSFFEDKHLEFVKDNFVPSLQSLAEPFSALNASNAITMEALKDAQGYLPSADWGTHTKYLRLALEEAYFERKTPEEALSTNMRQLLDEIEQNQ